MADGVRGIYVQSPAFIYLFFFLGLRLEPRAWSGLGRSSTTKLYPSPYSSYAGKKFYLESFNSVIHNTRDCWVFVVFNRFDKIVLNRFGQVVLYYLCNYISPLY